MTYGFICYLETLQVLLSILCSKGRNIRDVTAKQIAGAVPIFDLLLYEKYFTQKYLSTFVQRLVPFFYKSDDGKCAFSVNVML
jgi:hypothetical protein